MALFFMLVQRPCRNWIICRTRFLHNIGLDQRRAFLDFNLAPLSLRRDISILGFLHKANLGLAHPSIVALFGDNRFNRPVRFRADRDPLHSKPLISHFCSTSRWLSLYRKFIFYMTELYNELSQDLVDCSSIKDNQKAFAR